MRFHQVLIDWELGDFTADEVLRSVKSAQGIDHLRNTRIVVCSGNDNQVPIDELKELGFQGYWRKPITTHMIAMLSEQAVADSEWWQPEP